MAYQRVRTKSSKASPPKISQELTLYFNLYTNGQHSGFDKLEKNERNRKSENGYTVRKDLGNINFKTAYDYFGVPTSSLNKVADLENCHKGLI